MRGEGREKQRKNIGKPNDPYDFVGNFPELKMQISKLKLPNGHPIQ